MINLLSHLKYTPPIIQACKFNNVDVILHDGVYYLHVDGLQWMAYNFKTHEDAYNVYAHWENAAGHVVVTGMGFGARESWILTKPEVTKLTIIEFSSTIIDYHRHKKSAFLNDPRVEVVNCDAREYKGTCDVLLLDHYETQSMQEVLNDAKHVHDNVQCKKFWFWPFERYIMDYRKQLIDRHGTMVTKYDAFQYLKHKFDFFQMPDFTPEQINLYCMMHHSSIFSRSELFLHQNCPDTQAFHNIYISV